MIDTHCHLYWENLKNKTNEIIKRAKEVWVKKFVNIWCDLKTTQEAKDQAENFEEIFFTVWVHPAEHEEKVIDWEKLEEMILHPKCIAIWECWFDFFHKPYNEKRQEEIFLKQIELAKKYNKPIVIHTREAWEKVLDFLEEHFDWKFVIHCFSENQDFANRVLKIWWVISIWWILTYPKAQNLRGIIKNFPLGTIMLETDAPFLAPQWNRWKVNEPAFMKEIAVKISELKWISIEEVIERTNRNAEKFFRI